MESSLLTVENHTGPQPQVSEIWSRARSVRCWRSTRTRTGVHWPYGHSKATPLHCEDGAEPGFALRDTLIGLRSFGQWIGFNNWFDPSLGHVIQGFVEIFRAILLAADDFNPLEEQLDQRYRKRFLVGAHDDEP